MLPPTIIRADKPKGMTSFQLVRAIQRVYNAKKAGHAGTLDPQATGVMLVGINEGTKLLSEYVGLPKTYEAEVLFGIRTDTGDLEGTVLEQVPATSFAEETVAQALTSLTGTHILPVPVYSATKQGGMPLHKRVRQGMRVIVPEREMTITEATLLSLEHTSSGQVATVRFRVSSGTYIRTLAEELGKRLGVPATLSGLRRTAVGPYTIDQCESVVVHNLQDRAGPMVQ
jgi:tRNA pseudouridine55 synthase